MGKRNRSITDKVRSYIRLSLKRQREGHISALRQAAEMLVIFILTGNGPGFYHMAGFWRRDISWRDKLGHLGASGYRKRLKEINPLEYRKIYQNKLSEKGLLLLLGLPTQRFLGFLHHRNGRTCSGAPLKNSDDLSVLLAAEQHGRVCFKQVEGWAGKGFEVVDIVDRSGELTVTTQSDKCTLDIPAFCASHINTREAGGMLIETYLEQHPSIAAFNPSSVNTFRIWVIQRQGEPSRVVLAYLRIGREGSLVDNQSSGGVVAPIDIDTGITGCAIDGLSERVLFPTHPDHGAVIEGKRLPFWAESVALAESSLNTVPGLGFAGMDIAVAKQGPVILEMNPCPDREGAAFTDMPTKRIFGC